MRIVVGEAAFRREMEGRELLEAFHGEENVLVEPTDSLTSGQLGHIVKVHVHRAKLLSLIEKHRAARSEQHNRK